MTIKITGRFTQTGKSIVPPVVVEYAGQIALAGGGNDGPSINSIEIFTISSLGNSTDFGDLLYARSSLSAMANAVRGVWAGGTGATGSLDYVTISSAGNASSFGSLTTGRQRPAAVSNGTNDRGIIAAGGQSLATIDKITISSGANATIFGGGGANMLGGGRDFHDGVSNGINERAMFVGGRAGAGVHQDRIEYFTISSPSSANDWGNLTGVKRMVGAVSNDTNNVGVFGGGYSGSVALTVIDYKPLYGGANASLFGDLTAANQGASGASNGVDERGVMTGGYFSSVVLDRMEYITINSPSNATNFGELLTVRTEGANLANTQA